jgi:hypothetical protein
MLPLDAGWRRAVAALLHRLVALLLALLASLTASSSPAPPVQPPPPPPAADAAELREAAFAASAAGVGFNGGVAQLRAAEFSRLRGTAYLDHAGAALYSETQVADVARALASSVMGNPRAWPLSRHAACCATAPQRPATRVAQLVAPPAAVARPALHRGGADFAHLTRMAAQTAAPARPARPTQRWKLRAAPRWRGAARRRASMWWCSPPTQQRR